jgi:F-box-like
VLFHCFIACACLVKMSLYSNKPPNQLGEDVLLEIFDQLDDEDLLRCETACRQWQNVLNSGTAWKRLFHRKIISSPQWRDIVQIYGVDVEKMETVHYRSLCRAIGQELKPNVRNWRTGNFKKTSSKNVFKNISDITVWGDRIAVYSCNKNSGQTFDFLHRTSLEVISSMKIPDKSSAVTNTEIVVVWDEKNMKILDTSDQLISEVPELDEDERLTWVLMWCCISGDRMAVLSRSKSQEKLSIWDVSNPLRVTRLKSRHFCLGVRYRIHSSMKMDEQFIVVLTYRNPATSIHVISKKTLDLHWQMSVPAYLDNFAVGKGLLLKYVSKQNEEYGVIQVYDVPSRTYLREIRIKALHESENFQHYVHFNSKFMVVLQRSENRAYKVNIYDLEAIKSSNSSADELLVHTSTGKFYSNRIVVTETEIFCYVSKKIEKLDFSSLELFRNEAKSVTSSLPWRSVWRSKGVDEEPLEPVRHMEVYKEVLEYFDELSTNCRTALKCFEVDLDQACFILHDDFINDSQLAEVKMYVADRNEKPHEVNEKTVQISENTHGSVMNMEIHLIDVTTGDTINKTKLDIDAVGCHMGGNLLVSVSKMAEHEHLLRVWRIENSLNLTHIKDVSIGDYNRYEWSSIQVDVHFIAVRSPNEGARTTINFISQKSFEVERSLSFSLSCFKKSFYDGGYLFLMNSDCLVRILDVTTGTFLRDIRIEPSSIGCIIPRVNSNYVVIATNVNRQKKNCGHSKLYVYDLKCLKETDTVPSHLLLTTIELECQVKKVLMNETRIACLSGRKMYVVDLKPIDRLRCPGSC